MAYSRVHMQCGGDGAESRSWEAWRGNMSDITATVGAQNRRESERQRCFECTRIVFNEGETSIDCVVRDVSANGARLVFDDTLGIPSAFKLVSSNGEEHPCVVKWRTNVSLGVAFDRG